MKFDCLGLFFTLRSLTLVPLCFHDFRARFRQSTRSRLQQWALIYFLFQACIQFILQSVFTSYLYLAPDRLPLELKHQSTVVLVYNILDMLPILFQVLIVLESVLSNTTIQLFVMSFLSLGPFASGALLSLQPLTCFSSMKPTTCDPFLVEFFIFSIVLSIVFISVSIFITLKLQRLYKWNLYKQLGADKQVLKRIQDFFFLTMMVRLDNFLYFCFNLQYFLVLLVNNFERWRWTVQFFITILFLSFSIGLCMKALHRHNQKYMMAFILCHIIRFIYLMVVLHLLITSCSNFIRGKLIAILSLLVCTTTSLINLGYAIKFIRYFDPDISWKFVSSSIKASNKSLIPTPGA